MTSSSSIIPPETLLVSLVIVAAPSFNNDGRPPDKNSPSFLLEVQKQIVYGLQHRHPDNKTSSIKKQQPNLLHVAASCLNSKTNTTKPRTKNYFLLFTTKNLFYLL
jgi:hypothetical protein